jgi:hypothetical protein
MYVDFVCWPFFPFFFLPRVRPLCSSLSFPVCAFTYNAPDSSPCAEGFGLLVFVQREASIRNRAIRRTEHVYVSFQCVSLCWSFRFESHLRTAP